MVSISSSVRPTKHIYAAVSCDGAIMLCQNGEPDRTLVGHSQDAYLFHYTRGGDKNYCVTCSSLVPTMQKELTCLAMAEL